MTVRGAAKRRSAPSTSPVASSRSLGGRLPSGTVIVSVAVVLYMVLLSTLSIVQHRGLKTQMNDLGNADQALWAAANGDWTMTQSNTRQGRPMSRLAIHANLIFWPLSLGYRIWPDPEWLLVLNSAACAIAGLGLYAIARRRLGDGLGAVVAPLAFFASPIVHDANLYDFHTITLATAFLVWAVWAFDAGRPRLAWGVLFGALLCQEDIPFVGAMLGFRLWWNGSRRQGLAVAAVSLTYLAAVAALLVPALTGEDGLMRATGDERYGWLGSTPLEIARTLFTEPGRVLGHVLSPDRLRLPLYLGLSGGVAAMRSWPMLLLTVPHLALGTLSQISWVTAVTGTYYWILCEAVIVLACIESAAVGSARSGRSVSPKLAYLTLSSAFFSLVFSPLPHSIGASWANYALPPERSSLGEIVARIPADATLCVQNNLGPHLSQRPAILAFRKQCSEADYVLFHLRWVGGPTTGLFARAWPSILFGQPTDSIVRALNQLIASPEWGLVAQRDGFYLFARNQALRVSRGPMMAEFVRDLSIFRQQLREAEQYRWKAAPLLTGRMEWKDLLRYE